MVYNKEGKKIILHTNYELVAKLNFLGGDHIIFYLLFSNHAVYFGLRLFMKFISRLIFNVHFAKLLFIALQLRDNKFVRSSERMQPRQTSPK